MWGNGALATWALRIGTRGSELALVQSRGVAASLERAHAGLTCEIVRITTTGDRRCEPLPAIGGKGLFTGEIEDALRRGEIDLAVHSLKDLPTELPEGLALGAVPERAPANDAVVSASGAGLEALPAGAAVGTSSVRRAAQVLRLRPDLRIVPIRGNVHTRIRKVLEGECEATVLALAGLVRLGIGEQATQVLGFEQMLPAPGQGALAVEIREEDGAVRELLAPIADPATTAATTAERALLATLGGGCSLPLGAHAEVDAGALRLRAVLLAPDASAAATAECIGPQDDPQAVAAEGAERLLQDGSDAILARLDAHPQ